MNGDAEVIAALRERGDPIDLARPVRHWAYSSSREGAALFRTWLADLGFEQVAIDEEPDLEDLTWRVTYEHVVVPKLETIAGHRPGSRAGRAVRWGLRRLGDLGGELSRLAAMLRALGNADSPAHMHSQHIPRFGRVRFSNIHGLSGIGTTIWFDRVYGRHVVTMDGQYRHVEEKDLTFTGETVGEAVFLGTKNEISFDTIGPRGGRHSDGESHQTWRKPRHGHRGSKLCPASGKAWRRS